MPHSDFIHLHLHTQYSLLDGACRIPELLALAAQYKMDSLAITDHGSMSGVIEFYMAAQKAGIKPIIGCEAYMAPGSRLDKTARGIDEAAYHFILLAKDEDGYRNLMKLVSAAFLEGFYYRPRIDKEILAQHSKGLIGLSACLKGEVAQMLEQRRYNDALKCADTYAQIMGKDNFYLEIQENLIPEQKLVNEGMLRLAKELNLPLAATNDVHYLKKEHAAAHDALLCIQTQSMLSDEKRMRLQTDEFYFKSPQEMKKLFDYAPQAIANTVEIAGRCNVELEFGKFHLPKYDPPGKEPKEDFLRRLCGEGMKLKIKEVTPQITDRLEYELKTIQQMGFTSYFLIVWDFVRYAKESNIPVGPGRGSAAGSLVSYLLNITDINPLNYGLIFERFLNPDRQGLPDIDIDFCYERRQEVIDYVTKKYGQENVAQIITFGTMQARAVVRDVGRVMGISYADVDRIAKMIPAELDMTLNKAMETEQELKSLYQNDPQFKQLITIALVLEGLNRHASIHAAGVVIADKPLTTYMPLFKSQDDQITSGYSMSMLEKIGLLKVDFLGLRTLTVIDQALKLIKLTQGKDLNLKTISLDDPPTYKLLTSAQTIGIFQLESSGMRDLLRKLEPERFEDIIALLALYRPGPIGSHMLDDFIARRHNRVAIRYDHKCLEPVLKETYGIIVYQEQIMQIASALAGFTMVQADLLRRAMSKKIPEVMEKQRKDFISGGMKNKISESIATKIFDLIEYFSGYGFNKCVVGSTEVIDADTGKLVTVREIFEDKNRVRSTFSCGDNLRIVKTRIKDAVYNGVKPVYKLKTALGREITATANHPVFTFKGWKELGDLKIGERIGLCRNLKLQPNGHLEPHQIIVLAGILSEGNTCHPSGVYFYNNSRVLVDDFVQNAQKFENTLPRITQREGNFEVYAGTGKDARFTGNQIPWNKGFNKETYPSALKLIPNKKSGVRLWVEELGLDYKKATEKSIPEIIFSLNNEQLALFLGRIWSGDGFIFGKNNSVPFYASSSQKLCRQLQDLFLRFGISTRLTKKLFSYKYKNFRQKKPGYALYLYGSESITAFIREICPSIIGRDEVVNQLRNYHDSCPSNLETKDTLPPEIKELVQEEKEKSGLSWKELEERTGVCMKEFYGKINLRKQGFRKNTIMRLAYYFESERLLRFISADITWDRVESVEYSGRQDTYDLEIEGIHNFIANGMIVHNSHSAAYAMISYRTAYLKANYPVEFMSALLTSERDNTDKIVEYVNESSHMGLTVLPPDINESDALFKVVDQKTIRFGLLAVKNVGKGAIESVIQARENGEYTSLEDLCRRVDSRLVNKKVLESLIKCGALDTFRMPRAQMFAHLEKIMDITAKTQKEKAKGQLSFFDQPAGENGFKDNLNNLPQVHEWPEPQVLAFEKEMLGFYVSGHPLARYSGILKRFASTTTSTLPQHNDGEEVKIVGLIEKIKQTLTRAKQEKMAILKLEDLEGAVEALVFPAAYQKVSRYLQTSTVVLATGRLNLKEDAPKIIINDLFPAEQVYKLITAMNINLSGLRENLFESLKELLSASRGRIPVYLHLDTPAKSRVQMVVGDGLYVEPNEKLIYDIEALLGEDRLTIAL